MKIIKLIRNQDGAVLPLVALILLIILAFSALVVDAGFLYSERRTMVTAVDSAALAGAKIMEEALGVSPISEAKLKAEKVAKDIAVANGVKNRDDIFVAWDNPNYTRDTITVTLKNNKNLIFGKFLGTDNTDVFAKAVGTWGYVTKLEGGDIIPIFTKDGDYHTNGMTYLHDGKLVDDLGDVVNGNWGFIDIFTNTSMIKDALRGDLLGGKMQLSAIIDNEQGNAIGQIQGPVEDRMQRANLLPEKEDRVKFMSGLVPVIDWGADGINITQQGSKLKLPVKYFAVFEILDVITSEGNDKEIGHSGYQPSVGSEFALYDNDDYLDTETDNAKIYHDKFDGEHLEKGTLIGKFTGATVEVRAIVQDGDQTNPNPSIMSAKYSKLIE